MKRIRVSKDLIDDSTPFFSSEEWALVNQTTLDKERRSGGGDAKRGGCGVQKMGDQSSISF
jgi:hypothetical protein